MTAPVPTRRLVGVSLLVSTVVAGGILSFGGAAHAADVPSVALATSGDYAVLGATTVTNTGNSVLDGSLGLSPGASITGFPPGLVVPPGTTEAANAVALQAQSDLAAAYVDAAGRPITATTTADLANLNLQAGVYAGPAKSALSLTGPLVLDGAGDVTSVFIFQTDSTLITGSGSTVSLVNGAQECNVFWQVGSSATLGTGSLFAGNVLALTSITVNTSVTVHGRALARNGAVTLDNDTFTRPTCALPPSVTPTTSGPTTTTDPTTAGPITTSSSVPEATTTTTAATNTSTPPGDTFTVATTGGGGGSPIGTPADGTSTTTGRSTTTALTGQGLDNPDVPPVLGPPRTGADPLEGNGSPWRSAVASGLLAGVVTVAIGRRRGMRPGSAEPARH